MVCPLQRKNCRALKDYKVWVPSVPAPLSSPVMSVHTLGRVLPTGTPAVDSPSSLGVLCTLPCTLHSRVVLLSWGLVKHTPRMAGMRGQLMGDGVISIPMVFSRMWGANVSSGSHRLHDVSFLAHISTPNPLGRSIIRGLGLRWGFPKMRVRMRNLFAPSPTPWRFIVIHLALIFYYRVHFLSSGAST